MGLFARFEFSISQRRVMEPVVLAGALVGCGGFMTFGTTPGIVQVDGIADGSTISASRSMASPVSGIPAPVSVGAQRREERAAQRFSHAASAPSPDLLSRMTTSGIKPGYVLRFKLPAAKPAIAPPTLQPALLDVAPLALPLDAAGEVLAGKALDGQVLDGPVAEVLPAPPGEAPALALPSFADRQKVSPGPVSRLTAFQGDEPVALNQFPGIGAVPAEVRNFDLASITPANAVKRAADKSAEPGRVRPAASPAMGPAPAKDRLAGDFIFHMTSVQVNQTLGGNLEVRIGGGDGPSLRLGDLVTLFGAELDPEIHAAVADSASAAEFVSFAAMRKAGIYVRYDAGEDRVVLSAR